MYKRQGIYLQNAPLDEPVYPFMDRKRAEGKPFRVYMMASANKFLRIYYATVKASLESLAQVCSPHPGLAGRRFKFETRSGLVWCGLFAQQITLKFLLRCV